MSTSLPNRFAEEWKALEKKATLGFADHGDVAAFLRDWTLTAATASAEQQTVLLNLIETARQTLMAQVNKVETLREEGRRRAQDQAQQQREASRRAEDARRRQEQERRAAQERLRRTQEETREIERETQEANRRAADRRHEMNRRLTNPELFCPHCNASYADATRGCRHCSTFRYP